MVREMTPVLLITGSLGSGKTTLLNHLLSAHHGKKIAVFVNDFGPINVDAALLAYQGNVDTDNIIEFSNGCICCSINGDVQQALQMLETKRDKLDVVIVETSGVCDVGPIVDTLRRAVGELWRLDGVLCVADAGTLAACNNDTSDADESTTDGGSSISGTHSARQMAQADCIIANKMDHCSNEEARLRVLSRIKKIAPNVPILLTVFGKIDVDVLAIKHDVTRPIIAQPSTHHAHALHAWHYERADRPFCPLAFEDIAWPASIVRAKGFVWLDGCPQVVVFHLCGRRSNPFETLASMGAPSKSSIVFMQTTKEDEAQVRALLDAAVLPC
eukprot:GEMP01063253.1.p1 GENE.GEMP01063253.1~~GEMP01063253.1.p1  ORF type:complete len:329 (+),score=94.95 GEMP01063253.1:163-1149(+)